MLTRAEAALRARVSVATVDRAIRDGRLRAARPAGTRAVRICPEWVDAWIERGAERPPADRPSAP